MHPQAFAPRVAVVLSLALLGCRARSAAPPQGAKGQGARVERVLVLEKGTVAMVKRGGCVATAKSGGDQIGTRDELGVRCPRPERLAAWFDAVDKLTASVPVEHVGDKARPAGAGAIFEDDVPLPAAQIVTAGGAILRMTNRRDVAQLAGAVNALSAELAAHELPGPGPTSPAGWQMLHVTGPARVSFAGSPARGVFEARVSTNGQYQCEFITHGDDGPVRAMKSGWISPTTATKAIDEVLVPFQALGPQERARPSYAAAIKGGAESKADAASSAAVFERFAPMQDALGDACLPQLESPTPPVTGI